MRVSACLVLVLVACGGPTKKDTMPTDDQDTVGEGTGEAGSARENALEVCGPEGAKAHLEAQACADGSKPTHRPVGNAGKGPDGHILNMYELRCPERTWQWFMDTYHCEGVEPG